MYLIKKLCPLVHAALECVACKNWSADDGPHAHYYCRINYVWICMQTSLHTLFSAMLDKPGKLTFFKHVLFSTVKGEEEGEKKNDNKFFKENINITNTSPR